MESRGTLCHSLIRGQKRFIYLILHLNQACCPIGGDFIICNHCGDIIAIDANSGVQKLSVRHILMSGFHGPGMARSGKLYVRHFETGDYFYHTGDLKGFFQIKAFHHTVGNGTVYDFCHQQVLRRQVRHIFCSTGNLLVSVDTF